MAGETWAKEAAEIEFEENPRTVSPFAHVIEEYRRHGQKAVRRDCKNRESRRTQAALYYFEQAAILGVLDGSFKLSGRES